jgi:hypothetical protein
MVIKRSVLICIAVLIAISLSYSEIYNNNLRVIDGIDEFNNIKLALSAYNSIKKGIVPIHIGDGILCNLGYPIHQFYSPLPYIIIALFSFVDGNIYTGFSITVILAITLAFIYIFKLIKYLFNNDIYALLGSFVYICSPYFSIVRVIRGAYPEFFAICLLPIFLYFIVRCINKFSIKYLTYSIITLNLLFLTHLITSVYIIFFSGFFLAIHACIVIIKTFNDKKIIRLIKLRKKVLILISILILSILLAAWHLGPVVFYKNIFIKDSVKINELYNWRYNTNIFSLFSINDAPTELSDKVGTFRLQIGFIFNLSLLYLLLIMPKKYLKSSYILPLIITQLFIFLIILYPFGERSFIQKIFFLTQFTYRFISLYNLIGVIILILTIKCLISGKKIKLKYIIKSSLPCIIILYCIISSSLYQRDYKGFNEESLVGIYRTKKIYENDSLFSSANIEYLIQFPIISDYILPMNKDFLIKQDNSSALNRKVFTFNIKDYLTRENYNNYVDLDILYYPQLQDINIMVDNIKSNNIKLEFYRKNIYIYYTFKNQIVTIYGLRISNLPAIGKIKVIIRFTGYFIANLISQITFVIYILFLIIYWRFSNYKKIIGIN